MSITNTNTPVTNLALFQQLIQRFLRLPEDIEPFLDANKKVAPVEAEDFVEDTKWCLVTLGRWLKEAGTGHEVVEQWRVPLERAREKLEAKATQIDHWLGFTPHSYIELPPEPGAVVPPEKLSRTLTHQQWSQLGKTLLPEVIASGEELRVLDERGETQFVICTNPGNPREVLSEDPAQLKADLVKLRTLLRAYMRSADDWDRLPLYKAIIDIVETDKP